MAPATKLWRKRPDSLSLVLQNWMIDDCILVGCTVHQQLKKQ